jgi:hypothetical protein
MKFDNVTQQVTAYGGSCIPQCKACFSAGENGDNGKIRDILLDYDLMKMENMDKRTETNEPMDAPQILTFSVPKT